METLSDTQWDVIIAGTGVQEALLALALSRSDKKILHIDRNDYYGGSEAALSLQEAEAWVEGIRNGDSHYFSHAAITTFPASSNEASKKLSFPRAYSIALAPQLVYARSSIIPALVSSRVDEQLEFLAVSNWWIPDDTKLSSPTTFIKVPGGREDLFEDSKLDLRTKRAFMKFLRFIVTYEDHPEVWQEYAETPLERFLQHQFKLPPTLQLPIQSLIMTPDSLSTIPVNLALPRIARHLRSIGIFGPGFGAVIPKWGGLSELAQVGCRACAVGGGVYVLKSGIESLVESPDAVSADDQNAIRSSRVRVKLSTGDTVSSSWLVTGPGNQVSHTQSQSDEDTQLKTCRAVYIVSSSLTELIGSGAEGAPKPAGAVVVIPPSPNLATHSPAEETASAFPVHLMVHSSDTGECPTGQCVIYGSLIGSDAEGFEFLDKTVQQLLRRFSEDPEQPVLWKMQYLQHHPAMDSSSLSCNAGLISFPSLSADLAFDDEILLRVKSVWKQLTDGNDSEFLAFKRRELSTEEQVD